MNIDSKKKHGGNISTDCDSIHGFKPIIIIVLENENQGKVNPKTIT